MKVKNVRLFSRAMCSWCMDAKEWLDRHGIDCEYIDVGTDAAAQAEMVALSNQQRVPVIEVEGQILADFGADELEAWWKKMGFEMGGVKRET
jgi:monothiol glutaredoxin